MAETVKITDYTKSDVLSFIRAFYKKKSNSLGTLKFVKEKHEAPKDKDSIDYSKVTSTVKTLALSMKKPEFLIDTSSGHIYGVFNVKDKTFYFFRDR